LPPVRVQKPAYSPAASQLDIGSEIYLRAGRCVLTLMATRTQYSQSALSQGATWQAVKEPIRRRHRKGAIPGSSFPRSVAHPEFGIELPLAIFLAALPVKLNPEARKEFGPPMNTDKRR